MKTFPLFALGVAVAVAGCSVSQAVPTADPSTVASIESKIVAACTADGMFRPVVKAGVTVAVPIASVPLAVIEAGIDKVCADPASYAADAGTVAWVVSNLRDIVAALKVQPAKG